MQSKESMLKVIREKASYVKYKGKHTRIIADYSMETLKARASWSTLLCILKAMDDNLDLCTQENHLS